MVVQRVLSRRKVRAYVAAILVLAVVFNLAHFFEV
jgi:hypothetical protein